MIRSQIKTCRTSRSYSPDEIARVIEHQSEKNALSTLIAFFAGLRAHELATLRRSDESQPSARRQWDSRRFAGLNNVTIYIVTGKGGLPRHGHIVIALVDGERLVKRLFKRAGRVALVAENPVYPTLEILEGMDLEVWGVVVGKFKRLTS
jgi:integrase